MDSKLHHHQPPEPEDSEAPPPPFSASISLSLSLSLSTLLLPPPKTPSPSRLTIPFQIASIFNPHLHLSLSTPPSPSKPFFKSTSNPSLLRSPLPLLPLRPSNPSSAAPLRRASLLWFRNDLRVTDHEPLASSTNDSLSVLPVYCFDPRDYGKSSSGFDKTGPYRATFVLESVRDLKKSLQERGSDLVVRIGKPEVVLLELAKAVGAGAVYAHREVGHDEVEAEEKIEATMKEEGIEVKYFWGSTLYHVDDLGFKVEDMPTTYGGFKDKVKGVEVRKTIEALDQLKGLPSKGDVEPGEIPSLLDLGLNPSAAIGQVF